LGDIGCHTLILHAFSVIDTSFDAKFHALSHAVIPDALSVPVIVLFKKWREIQIISKFQRARKNTKWRELQKLFIGVMRGIYLFNIKPESAKYPGRWIFAGPKTVFWIPIFASLSATTLFLYHSCPSTQSGLSPCERAKKILQNEPICVMLTRSYHEIGSLKCERVRLKQRAPCKFTRIAPKQLSVTAVLLAHSATQITFLTSRVFASKLKEWNSTKITVLYLYPDPFYTWCFWHMIMFLTQDDVFLHMMTFCFTHDDVCDDENVVSQK